MPKYCSVPNCRTAPGDRKSFYKFPLHDPERLNLWLRNMGRNNWTPSRHQYICHEHFAPSNFKVRWGIRYLKNTAVPTLFQKKKVIEESERRTKRLWANDNQSVMPGGSTKAVDAPLGSGLQSKYKLSDLGQLCESGDGAPSLQTENPLASKEQWTTEMNFPITLLQTVEDCSGIGDEAEMVLISEDQEEHVNGFFTSGLTEVQGIEVEASLRLEDVTCTTVDFSNVYEDHQTQDVAYFEVIPNLFSSPTAQFLPETVLSSALSHQPITSTLPIVSKHVHSSESIKSPDTEEEEDDDVRLDYSSFEYQQQAEHCYHKNSMNKEQLEAIVAELQKKVKILQQRHRRHLDKLLGLEKMVGQLRQSNLLYEERLQLLERAYLQTNVAISDPGEIVTIIYEEENPEYFCTPLNVPEETL